MPDYTSKDIQKFWSNLSITLSPDECWEWLGRRVKGYGMMCVSKRSIGAHRISWGIHNGTIPEGMSVLHKCDNPSCVNPNHLFLGTQADNIRDMMIKKRDKHPSGENHKNHKLVLSQVENIRLRYKQGGITFKELASEFGVSQSAINNIIQGNRWK